jgi:hypothetical protein
MKTNECQRRNGSSLEGVAVELACLIVEARGLRDVDVLVRSDNVGVIGTFGMGRGRNFMVTFSIRRTDPHL